MSTAQSRQSLSNKSDKGVFMLLCDDMPHPDHGSYPFLASDFATSRACSIKSWVTGLSVRLLRVRIPIGTGGSGSSTGKTLNGGLAAGNFNLDVEKIERKRPVA